ncbi:hypothetical protein [Paremcibacter congregatus]|uniref:Uncharacterized protein n=1 Tax=Paremcibacter congregatus TaxID=2043170 RepID=A0A2G4YT08_9PROT|nr:hypothetical protein [Paremcibacter congregatus]PHZ85451.1 hypothetical protein CRD36_06765 [Paremcibacter congregatus]PHZ85472.1 hypothetical protein CRD36_06660 [Paremcibacter congregatus]QDE27288.1 hypothetical protein FIV45_08310 [Paremcibacter congregatus]
MKKTTPPANDNLEIQDAPELDVSEADILEEMNWDNSTDHLDEITPEPAAEDMPEYDKISGLDKSEIFSKEEFFSDFFCQNLVLAEHLTGLVGVSVVVSDGKPEAGARETSDLLYEQCQKFRFLQWAIKRDAAWVTNVLPVVIFVKGKADIVGMQLAARREAVKRASQQPQAANDNNAPMEEAV